MRVVHRELNQTQAMQADFSVTLCKKETAHFIYAGQASLEIYQ